MEQQKMYYIFLDNHLEIARKDAHLGITRLLMWNSSFSSAAIKSSLAMFCCSRHWTEEGYTLVNRHKALKIPSQYELEGGVLERATSKQTRKQPPNQASFH